MEDFRKVLDQAKMKLVSAREKIAHDLSQHPDAELADAPFSAITDVQSAIDAIDAAKAGRWSATKVVMLVSVTSALIAAAALLLNGISFSKNLEFQREAKRETLDFQREAKQVDAAISWCREFYLPSFVKYQAGVRALKPPDSPYRLPNKEDIKTTAALSYSEIKNILDQIDILNKEEKESIQANFIGLLNYIDTGAQLALKGDMESSRFVACFRPFAESYFERYDHSYFGLLSAVLSPKNKDGTLQVAADQFPFAACIFMNVCDPENMATH
jgi:hypothetical protein